MHDATFTSPDLTTFARLDELGLEVTGQHLEPNRAVLACRVTQDDEWCHRCGCEGRLRDTLTRRLAHEPLGWRPTTLLVRSKRYRCIECGHVWRQDTSRAARPRTKLSRRGRGRGGLDTANVAVLAEAKRALINDPARFDGVAVIGVDEHVWWHTRRG